jgi:GAF domain-containing protein
MPRDTPFHAAARDLLVELSDTLVNATDASMVVAQAVAGCVDALDADFGKVLELLPDGDEMRLVDGVGWTPGLVGSATVEGGWDSQGGYALMYPDNPVVVTDLGAEHRFHSALFLSAHSVRAGISAVIPGKGGPWGVFGVHYRQPRQFERNEICLVRSVANVMGLAIASHAGTPPPLTRHSPLYHTPLGGPEP